MTLRHKVPAKSATIFKASIGSRGTGISQGGAGNGIEKIDRHRIDVKTSQGQTEFEPLFDAFTQTKKPTTADFHACRFGHTNGFQIFFVVMRGADLRKIGPRRFQVVMIGNTSGIGKCVSGHSIEKPQRRRRCNASGLPVSLVMYPAGIPTLDRTGYAPHWLQCRNIERPVRSACCASDTSCCLVFKGKTGAPV